MSAHEDPEQRVALLDFVERHWHELTLQDARSLSIETVELLTRASDAMKTVSSR